MSLIAKLRPASGCLREGGGGCGYGSSSNFSTKAPKSSLTAFTLSLPFFLLRCVSARITIPATVSPIIAHAFGFDMLDFTTCTCLNMIPPQSCLYQLQSLFHGRRKRDNGGGRERKREGGAEGFRRALGRSTRAKTQY